MGKCVFCGEKIEPNDLGWRNYVKSEADGKGHFTWCPEEVIRDVDDGSVRTRCGEPRFYDGTGESPSPAMCCGRSKCQKMKMDALRAGCDSGMRDVQRERRRENEQGERKAKDFLSSKLKNVSRETAQ